MWFELSAAQGDQTAVTDRDAAARRMTQEQIAEAQKLAREWKPKKEEGRRKALTRLFEKLRRLGDVRRCASSLAAA
jgi:hypothetical protein